AGPKPPIKINTSATASIQRHVVILMAVDNEVLDARAFDVAATNNRENGGGLRSIVHHAIGVQRMINRKRVSVSAGYPGDCGVKSARVLVPNRQPIADFKPGGISHGNLLLAIISVER